MCFVQFRLVVYKGKMAGGLCSFYHVIGVETTGAPGAGAPLDFLIEIYCELLIEFIAKCIIYNLNATFTVQY